MPSEKKAGDDETTAFPHPEPMELAKLAAILRPDFQHPSDALKIAMEWYFEAVLFCRELPLSPEQLFEKFASDERRKASTLPGYVATQRQQDRLWTETETLVLDPSQKDDDVRRYLCASGLPPYNRARTVLAKVKQLPRYLAERQPKLKDRTGKEIPWPPFVTGDELLARCTKLADGTIAIPRILLDDVIKAHNAAKRKVKLASYHRKKRGCRKAVKKNLKKNAV